MDNGNQGKGMENAENSLNTVVVLDAGGQSCMAIERRIRQLNVSSIILPLETSAKTIQSKDYKAVVISGGPKSINDPSSTQCDAEVFKIGVPVLGICYGMQAMNTLFGGKVAEGKVREDGIFNIKVDNNSVLFSGLQERQEVLLMHYEEARDIAPDFKVTATSGDIIAAIENHSKKLYGVQFHPEADLTENGDSIMRNFLFRIAGCHEDLEFTSTEDTCMEEIKREIGPVNKVLALVSGGVDSTVCTALLHKAIGPSRIVAVHIDNGFLRKNESMQVVESLSKIGLKTKVVNAQHAFYNGSTEITLKRNDINIRQNTGPLHSVSNPEEKRKIIGDMFVKVVNATIRDLNLDPKSTMVALGTTYLNLIESGSALASRRASKIKTHHNDSEMFQELRHQRRVLEPLKYLQKNDVCTLGKKLGLPLDIVHRHPFPGPGLAIRVLCANGTFMGDDFEDTNTKLGLIVDYCTAVSKRHPLLTEIQEQLTEEELETLKEISSKFSVGATLLPIRLVGIQGDCRTYSYVAAISSDSPPSWSSLMVYAKIIPKLCFKINRVVYLFGSRLLHRLQEVTPTFLVPNIVDTLRQIDYLANATLIEYDKMNCVSQMPIILVSLHFDRDPVMRLPSCHRSVVIRMFITNDFMAGIAATPGKQMPEELIMKIVDRVKSVPGVSRVMYDLTSKPPGTIEWE